MRLAGHDDRPERKSRPPRPPDARDGEPAAGTGEESHHLEHHGAQKDGGEKLTPAQLKALAALAAGRSVTEAAALAEVDRTTVHRWLGNHPVFRAEYNAARLEQMELARSELRNLAGAAIAALGDLMK